MKRILLFILSLVVLGAVGGYIYWSMNKKKVVGGVIDKMLANKTDSLYYIHYDSSAIDEVAGNASFYNVSLQSDSAQKQLLNSTDSLPNVLYNIRVAEVKVTGVDVPGLIANQNVAASKIYLYKPYIQVINTGADNPKPFTYNDTLELYEKITGKFKSIKADTIQIVNGTVIITNRAGKPLSTLENINIGLNNFLIDSTRNYQNILSYFIKDVRLTVENIQLPESKNKTRINIGQLDYDAAKRTLHIKEIQQYQTNNSDALTDLKNIQVNELNTDAFITRQQLNAGSINCDGGVITIYKKKRTANVKEKTIQFSAEMVDEAQLSAVNLGNTKIIVINPDEPAATPFILNNVRFILSGAVNVSSGKTLSDLITDAPWQLYADGFSFISADKLYAISINGITVNNADATANIKNISLKPRLSEKAFVQQLKHQQDMYDLGFRDIVLTGINTKKLLSDNQVEIDNASLQLSMKVFRDRTITEDSSNKVGKYPHQLLMKLKIPVYIKTMRINNGEVAYRERADKSEMIGKVFFTKIKATVSNFTNMPERIKENSFLHINIKALFLGVSNLSSDWDLPLNTKNGAFIVKGTLGTIKAPLLNDMIEPLALASIKEGTINKLVFNLSGTDYKATGKSLFLYDGLKVDLLKKVEGQDELKKRNVVSFFANTIVKNSNTNLTATDIDYERDTTKSFFNLLWKSIFSGVKKTAMGKK